MPFYFSMLTISVLLIRRQGEVEEAVKIKKKSVNQIHISSKLHLMGNASHIKSTTSNNDNNNTINTKLFAELKCSSESGIDCSINKLFL